MCEDDEGFLYPVINQARCVSCGLCERACPVVGNHQANSEIGQKSYLAISEHESHYAKSATIGICTMLAQYVIEQGGRVFGVALDETSWKTSHICVSDETGIERIRNSKYIQSDPCDTYAETRNLLKQGIMVLYIGTPCQIAGLKAYLRHDFENLLTIDSSATGYIATNSSEKR